MGKLYFPKPFDHSWNMEFNNIKDINSIANIKISITKTDTTTNDPSIINTITGLEPFTTIGFPHGEEVFVRRVGDTWETCLKDDIFHPDYEPFIAVASEKVFVVYDKDLNLVDHTEGIPGVDLHFDDATTTEHVWIISKKFPPFKKEDGLFRMDVTAKEKDGSKEVQTTEDDNGHAEAV